MWRSLRRAVGYWIAGEELAVVHCGNCGHVTGAFCTIHRDELLHDKIAERVRVVSQMPTREIAQVMPR